MSKIEKQEIWVTSPVLTNMNPQLHSIIPKFSIFEEERKTSSSYRKQRAPPSLGRECHFLSMFSISKECSGTEFVDRNHRGREVGTVRYGLPGFSESARVIKLQCLQAAKRPKERSCI